MFGNKVLRKIFGSRKGQVSEQFGILCNEELCDSYGSPSTATIVECWTGAYYEVDR